MELNNILQERRTTAQLQSLPLALRLTHFACVFFYLSDLFSVLLSGSPIPRWLSERRPFGISFIIIYFLPQNIMQDHSFHCHVNNDYSQLFIPSSRNSIPFHPMFLLYLHFGFGKSTSNSTSRTEIHDPIPIWFNSSITYPSERSTMWLIVQDGKLGLVSKTFFFSVTASFVFIP